MLNLRDFRHGSWWPEPWEFAISARKDQQDCFSFHRPLSSMRSEGEWPKLLSRPRVAERYRTEGLGDGTGVAVGVLAEASADSIVTVSCARSV
jgi:hypothetical protein